MSVLSTPQNRRIAYVVYALLLLAAIVFLGWRWNLYVRRKYKRRMEEYQTTKEKEMYKSKINFFINLVHEIRTPLSLIRLPLEKLPFQSNNGHYLNHEPKTHILPEEGWISLFILLIK